MGSRGKRGPQGILLELQTCVMTDSERNRKLERLESSELRKQGRSLQDDCRRAQQQQALVASSGSSVSSGTSVSGGGVLASGAGVTVVTGLTILKSAVASRRNPATHLLQPRKKSMPAYLQHTSNNSVASKSSRQVPSAADEAALASKVKDAIRQRAIEKRKAKLLQDIHDAQTQLHNESAEIPVASQDASQDAENAASASDADDDDDDSASASDQDSEVSSCSDQNTSSSSHDCHDSNDSNDGSDNECNSDTHSVPSSPQASPQVSPQVSPQASSIQHDNHQQDNHIGGPDENSSSVTEATHIPPKPIQSLQLPSHSTCERQPLALITPVVQTVVQMEAQQSQQQQQQTRALSLVSSLSGSVPPLVRVVDHSLGGVIAPCDLKMPLRQAPHNGTMFPQVFAHGAKFPRSSFAQITLLFLGFGSQHYIDLEAINCIDNVRFLALNQQTLTALNWPEWQIQQLLTSINTMRQDFYESVRLNL